MTKPKRQLQEKYYGFLYHYYRAEVYRETSWRNRLDVTTNWSIVVTAAILSFAFGNPSVGAGVFAINYLIVWFFLYMEARRFRYYALVRDRVKLFEKGILGNLFGKRDLGNPLNGFLEDLSDKLQSPKVTMSRVESLSWRLRRNYLFVLSLIYSLWFFRVLQESGGSISSFIKHAEISSVPGVFVFIILTGSLLWAIGIGFYLPQRYSRNDLP